MAAEEVPHIMVAPAVTTTSVWAIDASHSLVEFTAKHLMFTKVKGTIPVSSGRIIRDEEDFTNSTVEVTLDVTRLASGDEKRDAHLRSADFFDVENHGEATFVSTHVSPLKGDEFVVTGDLTIRGVTRPVDLKATFNGVGKSPWGTEVGSFSAETTLNREDFGLTWNVGLEAGGVLVGKEIKLSIEAEAIKQ
jgi:polyisoprenoid-binding protein YceI